MEQKNKNIPNRRPENRSANVIRITKMPKQFEKHLLESFDKRFILILFLSFVVHFATAFYFAINPPSAEISKSEIRKIQEQYASLVLKKEVIKEEVVEINQETKQIDEIATKEKKVEPEKEPEKEVKVEKKSEQVKETKVESVEGRKERRGTNTAARKKTRDQISKEVSSKGLLGLLSGSGSAASGEGVTDVLGDIDQTNSNLDDVFGQIDGLKKADGSGSSRRGARSVKGTRVTDGGGIDDLLTDRGTAKSTDIGRGGDLVVESLSSVANVDGIKSQGRDADDVSEVVAKHNSAIHYCYQRELKRSPDLKGKVVVRFTVKPSGKVSIVTIVSTTLKNKRVERCIVNRIKRWDDFGSIVASKGDATFRQVYTFGY